MAGPAAFPLTMCASSGTPMLPAWMPGMLPGMGQTLQQQSPGLVQMVPQQPPLATQHSGVGQPGLSGVDDRRPFMEHLLACFPEQSYLGFIPGRVPAVLGAGEYALCGLILHPSLAAMYRDMQKSWLETSVKAVRNVEEMRRLYDPAHFTHQFHVQPCSITAAGLSMLDGANAGIAAAGVVHSSGVGCGDPLPPTNELSLAMVKPVAQEGYSGRGLVAAQDLPRGTTLGVLAGYVMPAAHSRYPNDLLKGVASQLGVRASRLKFELYRYSASLEIVTPGGAPMEVTVIGLGSGNLSWLINDVHMCPSDSEEDEDEDDEQAEPNVTVLPILVRGMPIPFLVTTRAVLAGEFLHRAYGSAWKKRHRPLMDRAKLSEADVFERDTSLALHADDAILAAVRVGSTATHVRSDQQEQQEQQHQRP